MRNRHIPFKAAAGALAATMLLSGCGSATANIEYTGTYDPTGKSILQLAADLDSGATTSVELVEYYLQAIERNDDKGARIHAITEINPHAIRQARLADRYRKDHPQHSPLYGLPFVVKENYDVEWMATTAGSEVLKDNVSRVNAPVVQDLIDEGAFVLAKTNMSELAASFGRLGYSSQGGQTKNPYNLRRDPSGSSSGTAVAVAAGFAPFGLGSDTSGSVRGPASVTGLVGMRPTFGNTSRTSVVPLSSDFDVTGAITNTVEDQAIVLDAIVGPDEEDPVTEHAERNPQYFERLHQSGLNGATLGVVNLFNGGNEEVDEAFRQAQKQLEQAGAKLVTIDLDESYLNLWSDVMGPVGDAEFVRDYEWYMRHHGARSNAKTVRQLVDKSKELKGTDHEVNPARIEGYETNLKAADKLHGDAVQSILNEKMPQLTASVERTMADNAVSALIYPTLSCPASVRYDAKDPTYQCEAADTYAASYLASAAHLPELTVPMGRDMQNMPLGLSFVGSKTRESTLLNLGAAYERISPYRNGEGLKLR